MNKTDFMPECCQLMAQNNTSNSIHDQWSSKWAFILAATGAAVGLGNVWRFPYTAGINGGSAFVLVYLICVIVIGLPILIAEIIIGRHARKNPVDALSTLAQQANHSRHWGLLGWWGALALLLVLSFYSVVSGWSIAYLIKGFSGQFAHLSTPQIKTLWSNFLANPWRLLAWHTLFIALTIGVIIRGVQAGLEKATKLMMPALYLILIVLVIYAGINGDFKRGVHFLFDFDASKITPNIIVAAMGHAFFTLALGAGAMLTYGIYVPKRINIASAVVIVAGLDVLVAFLSGLAIFPIVFANHLSPAAGPGLMFVTLPVAFAKMPFGPVVGGLFCVLLLFAAWTSSINLAEPLVIIFMKKLKLSRTRAAILTGFGAWLFGIGSLLSFNVWQHLKFFGKFTVFDLATNIPIDIILPIGGIGFAIFAGWIMQKTASREEVHPSVYQSWRLLVRYIAPLGIFIVFVGSLI